MNIEVDFEVYKAITLKRASEQVTENDVLREVFGLPPRKLPSQPLSTQLSGPGDWIVKGVRFPAGTELRARYKGRTYIARVESGALVLDGKRHDSPSSAAVEITGKNVNGWRFWQSRLPGQSEWRIIEALRKSGA